MKIIFMPEWMRMLNMLLAFEIKVGRHNKMMIYINQRAVLTTALVECLFSYNQSDIAAPDNLFPKSSTISLTAPMVIAAIRKAQPIHNLLSKYIKNTDAAILSEILNAIFQISQKLSSTPALREMLALSPEMFFIEKVKPRLPL